MSITPKDIIPGLKKVEGGYFFPDDSFEALDSEDLDPDNGDGVALVHEIVDNLTDVFQTTPDSSRPTGLQVNRSPEGTTLSGTLKKRFTITFFRVIKKGRARTA